MARVRICALVLCVLLVGTIACNDGDGDAAEQTDQPLVREKAAPESGEGDGFAAIPDVVEEVLPSIVAVGVRGQQGAGEGSGIVWSEDGLIVTNHHVVAGADEVEVAFSDGERASARLRASDERTDVAVLEVDRTGLPAATFASGLPRLGQLAIAMGNPLGFEDTVTAGVVSGIDRSLPTGGRTPALIGLIQTDAAISPGNSGGALVDANALVVGMNVAYIPPQAQAESIGFAIPAPVVTDVVEQLLENGEVEHTYLGVRVAPLSPQAAEQAGVESGVGVLEVEPASPAQQAGIEPGDVIAEIDGEPTETVEDLYTALREAAPGDQLDLTVSRKGDQQQLQARLGERP